MPGYIVAIVVRLYKQSIRLKPRLHVVRVGMGWRLYQQSGIPDRGLAD